MSYFLKGLNVMYKLGAAVHRNLYEMSLLRKTRLDIPVIGVGNLSFGGSGKTLVVRAIADRLMEQGRKVGVICRSYGAEPGPHLLENGDQDPYAVGDEAAMLAKYFGEKVRVASGSDKTAAARFMTERIPDLDCIIVDDAYQHHRLHQDIKILIWPKPGARTREFQNVLRRADVLLVPNGHRSPLADSETVYFVKEIIGIWDVGCGISDFKSQIPNPKSQILLLAGLGPESDFFDHVQRWGLKPAGILRLPDHADYRRPEIQAELLRHAESADAIVTTAKDAVKLARLALPLPPIYVVRVGVKFLTNEEMLWEKISSVLRT